LNLTPPVRLSGRAVSFGKGRPFGGILRLILVTRGRMLLRTEVRDGKILEDSEIYDALGMLQQLGVVAPLGKAAGQSTG
jgi:hypothetical protein